MLFAIITSGNSFTIPEGFLFASISPASGASFTITNSLPTQSATVSSSISGVYSFPSAPGSSGWDAHIITASGGAVTITYATGR